MTFAQTLLWPLSVVYEAIAIARVWLYRSGLLKQQRLSGIVISVGNLTVGGTGKTPMVLWLAEALLGESKRVAILTRGYRGFLQSGAAKSPVVPGASSKGRAPRAKGTIRADSFGQADEATLLSRRLIAGAWPSENVAIAEGADRYRGGSVLTKQGFAWFILDDGFQHLRLARDLDVVLVDATNPFGGGHLLPAGRLREPRSALRRADIIVITRSRHAPAVEAIVGRHSSAPIFYATLKLESLVPVGGTSGEIVRGDAMKKKFFAFCGIGNPSAFFDNLREWGIEIAGHASFPDHHVYLPEELSRLEAGARAAGADALLCTEKDLCNLPNANLQAFPAWYCRVSLDVHDGSGFWQVAREHLRRRHPEIAL
ncbi:MAG: tetraacyldisaccharide 4'-kinase [Candidatus Acidiferrales bacterium]